MEISLEKELWFKEPSTAIELRDKTNRVIGGIITKCLDRSKVTLVTTAGLDEKYCLVYDGIMVYFTSWVIIK